MAWGFDTEFRKFGRFPEIVMDGVPPTAKRVFSRVAATGEYA
jgi:hypothetical protein